MRIRVVLTDLDGTLLEPDGSLADEAAAALRALASAGIPVCPVTSKTAAELEAIMRLIGVEQPAGFENGAGVRHRDGVAELLPDAVPFAELLDACEAARRATGAPVRTMLELGDAELEALTGLRGRAQAAARDRRATLPLVVDRAWDDALRSALPPGSRLTLVRGNRFLHLQGDHSKATAAPRLSELAGGPGGATVALGDAPNDADLLAFADVAVIVPGRGGADPLLLRRLPTARVAPEAHGRGWGAAVAALLGGGGTRPGDRRDGGRGILRRRS